MTRTTEPVAEPREPPPALGRQTSVGQPERQLAGEADGRQPQLFREARPLDDSEVPFVGRPHGDRVTGRRDSPHESDRQAQPADAVLGTARGQQAAHHQERGRHGQEHGGDQGRPSACDASTSRARKTRAMTIAETVARPSALRRSRQPGDARAPSLSEPIATGADYRRNALRSARNGVLSRVEHRPDGRRLPDVRPPLPLTPLVDAHDVGVHLGRTPNRSAPPVRVSVRSQIRNSGGGRPSTIPSSKTGSDARISTWAWATVCRPARLR